MNAVTDTDKIRELVRAYPDSLTDLRSFSERVGELLDRVDKDKRTHIKMLEDHMTWSMEIHAALDCAPFDKARLEVLKTRLHVPSPFTTQSAEERVRVLEAVLWTLYHMKDDGKALYIKHIIRDLRIREPSKG